VIVHFIQIFVIISAHALTVLAILPISVAW